MHFRILSPLRSAVLATALAASASAQDVRNGLISYWPLETIDDGTLETPDLVSGNHLTGLLIDSSAIIPGKRGNALTFDGIGQMLTLIHEGGDNRLPLYSQPQFTMTMWVRGFGEGQSDRRIFAEGSTDDRDTLLTLGTDNGGNSGSLNAYFRNDGGGVLLNHIKSVGQPLDGAWHHIAWVDEGGTVRVYIDGVADATAFNYTRGTLTLNTLSVAGIQRDDNSHYFFGDIDEVALWERALSEEEVQDIMTNGIQTPVPNLPPAFVTQPPPATETVAGSTVDFAPRVVGPRPMTFQWFRNDVAVAGATSAALSIPAVPDAAGTYRLEATNSAGTTSSDPAVLTVTDDSPSDLPNGLIAWWPFESATGDPLPVTTDSYGGIEMVLNEMTAANLVPGHSGNGVEFDGFSQIGTRSGGFPVTNLSTYTIAFWVNGIGEGSADLRIFAEGSEQSNTPLFAIGTHLNGENNALRVYSRSTRNTEMLNVTSTSEPLDGTWHHVAFVNDNGDARLYVDGIPDTSDFSHQPWPSIKETTSIGGIQRAALSHYFPCTLDDLALWSRALTFSEVQELVEDGVPAPPAQTPPAIAMPPSDTTIYQGMPVTLRAFAAGSLPLSYQWKRGDTPIAGATSNELVLDPTTAADAGEYTVEVTNASGTASASATLTLIPGGSLTTGLVSHWPFETIGGTTPDIVSGNDFEAVLIGSDSQVNGFAGNGQALSFDGIEQMLRRPAGNGLPIYNTGGYSVSFWVNGAFLEADRRIFSEGSSVTTNPLLNIGCDNSVDTATPSIAVYIRNDAGTVVVSHRKSAAPALDDTWHHVVWTDYNGDAALYIDGIRDDTNFSYDPRGTYTFDWTSVGGIQRATPSHWFPGMIDEVAVWSRPLLASEVLELKENGLPSDTVPPSERPVVQAVELIDGGTRVRIEFTAADSQPTSSAEQTDDPATGWQAVTGFSVAPGDGPNVRVAEFDAGPAGSRRYYRIRTGP